MSDKSEKAAPRRPGHLLWIAAGLVLIMIVLAWQPYNQSQSARVVRIPAEMVMHEGVSIDVTGTYGTLRIRALDGLNRKFEWRDCSLSSELHPRTTRWYGSLGAYDAGTSFGLSSGCEGISRPVVQEGQIHFDDETFARKWIHQRPDGYDTTWTDDGLLVSWAFVPGRSQLSVTVRLMCLNGRPFAPGSTPRAPLPKVYPNAEGQTLFDCVQVGQSEIDQTREQIGEFR